MKKNKVIGRNFRVSLYAVLVIIVLGFVIGIFLVVDKVADSIFNSPPDITKIGDNTYKWRAQFCMRGIYLTYDQDIETFKKKHTDLVIVDVKIIEYKDSGAPWRAIIKTKPRILRRMDMNNSGREKKDEH